MNTTRGIDCPYSEQITHDLEVPVAGQVVSENKERDKGSGEHLVKREFRFDSGDSVYIEQKYCSMYNLTIVYRLTDVGEAGFEEALDLIHSIVKSADQDYQLKSPLKNIVDMTMNQRNLTLNESFEYGLPLQAARSSENVEHTIGFELLSGGSEFAAEIQFYLGIGGLWPFKAIKNGGVTGYGASVFLQVTQSWWVIIRSQSRSGNRPRPGRRPVRWCLPA